MTTITCPHPLLPRCGADHPGGACAICYEFLGRPADHGRTFGPWVQTGYLPDDERVAAVAAHYRRWGLHPNAHVCADCGELVLGPSTTCPDCVLEGGKGAGAGWA